MIKGQNDEIDYTSTGLVVIILGLLIILFTPVFTSFFYAPREITGPEDKITRIPDHMSSVWFYGIGFFAILIGSALFFKVPVNNAIDHVNLRSDEKRNHAGRLKNSQHL